MELARRATGEADRCCGYVPMVTGADGIGRALPASNRLAAEMPEITVEGITLAFNFLRLSLQPQRLRLPFHLETDTATALANNVWSLAHVFPAITQHSAHSHGSGCPEQRAHGQVAVPSLRSIGRSRGDEWRVIENSADPSLHEKPWEQRLQEDERRVSATWDCALERRYVFRLLLNLSTARPRTLAYLDLDPTQVRLAGRGAYVQCVQPIDLERVVQLAIPPRRGRLAHGLFFCASRVLHTCEDDNEGQFVAGFGREVAL